MCVRLSLDSRCLEAGWKRGCCRNEGCRPGTHPHIALLRQYPVYSWVKLLVSDYSSLHEIKYYYPSVHNRFTLCLVFKSLATLSEYRSIFRTSSLFRVTTIFSTLYFCLSKMDIKCHLKFMLHHFTLVKYKMMTQI